MRCDAINKMKRRGQKIREHTYFHDHLFPVVLDVWKCFTRSIQRMELYTKTIFCLLTMQLFSVQRHSRLAATRQLTVGLGSTVTAAKTV